MQSYETDLPGQKRAIDKGGRQRKGETRSSEGSSSGFIQSLMLTGSHVKKVRSQTELIPKFICGARQSKAYYSWFWRARNVQTHQLTYTNTCMEAHTEMSRKDEQNL